ncbi:MAG: glucose 1-dehydrogenase, partial [Phenylobacterium sp.]|nr:glucose 1-dehydrogenase [Phenylobacterium sp.]
MGEKPRKAVVVGVGALEGLGGGLARRFAQGGHHVLVAGRTQARIDAVVDAIRQSGGAATAV